MRILVHDFAGYPYPVQLSRALARRGHTVRHVYCGSLQTTPGGNLARHPDDPELLEIKALYLARPLDKYAFVQRWRQENAFGRLLAEEVDGFRPEVVLSGNAPLDAQRHLLEQCRKRGARFVFWVQDLIGVAAARILRQKIPVLGAVVGRYYQHLEQAQLRKSDAVVLLTADFRPLLRAWSIPEEKVHVIENWAPLEEFPLRPKDGAWARARGLTNRRTFVYAGTMGMKHNPALLLDLSLRFRAEPDVRIVVLSRGLGADWLAEKKQALGLDNLLLEGFLPFDQMPDVMAAADVLVAVLEPEAGVFSVPSKVLAYLCAGRPVLLAVPPENLAARIVATHEAGLVAPPNDSAAFVEAGAALMQNADLRERLGRNARRYAEEHFDIERITDGFEHVLRPPDR